MRETLPPVSHGVTTTDRVVLFDLPALSVTVNITLKVPALANTWLIVWPDPEAPSPKLHENVVMVRPGAA